MNRKNSRELLAELQRRAGYVSREEQEAVLGSIKFPSEFGNAMEVYNQGIKGVEEKLPTKYQDPGEYVLLEHIFEDIRSFVKNLKTDDKRIKELPDIPTFGTVKMGSFSAQISGSGEGDYLILFANGMFGFANLLSKVIGDSFVLIKEENFYSFSTDFDQIKIRLEEKKEIQRHFNDLMMGYMIRENAHAARQYFPSRQLSAIASIIREGMEIFVAAHEYAHLILGHLSSDTRRIRVTGEGEKNLRESQEEDDEIKESIYNWKDEVEADSLAVIITMGVMTQKGYDRALSFMGPGTAMLGMELLEGLENLKEGRDPQTPRNSKTHPSGNLRKQVMYEIVKTDVPEALNLMESIEKIVQYLWMNYLEFYKNMEEATKKINENLSLTDIPFEIIQRVIYKTV